MRVMAYSPSDLVESDVDDPGKLRELLGRMPVVWLDIAGLRDVARIQQIGDMFGLHPLALEDAVHTHQRAKVDDYSDYLFLVARMAPSEGEEDTEQMAMFLGRNYLITFQERPGDCLGGIRDRIRSSKGRIRAVGPDYLAYSLLDTIIDAYFPLLEHHGEMLEDLEEKTILSPNPSILAQVYTIRRRLLTLRRAIWPLREAANGLIRDESHLVTADTRLFLRDCYDHTIQIIDLMETYRDLASGLMEVYLSSISNRMNQIMKVLTIITTVFIPLTFIAGVYGMNFNTQASPWNMPELNMRYGYVVCLGVMLLIAIVQFVIFWKLGWIGPKDTTKTTFPARETTERPKKETA